MSHVRSSALPAAPAALPPGTATGTAASVGAALADATSFAACAPIRVVPFGGRVSGPVPTGLGLCMLGGAALVARSLAFDPARAGGDGLGIATGEFFGLRFLAVGAARTRTGAARATFEMSPVTALVPPVSALALVGRADGPGPLSVALGRLPAAFSPLAILLDAIAAAAVAWAVLGEAVMPVRGLGGGGVLAGIRIARPRPVPAP